MASRRFTPSRALSCRARRCWAVSPSDVPWRWPSPQTLRRPGPALEIRSTHADSPSLASKTLQTLSPTQSHLSRPRRATVARKVTATAPAHSFIRIQSLCKAAEAREAACVSRRRQNLRSGQAFETRRTCYHSGGSIAVKPRALRMIKNGAAGGTRDAPWSPCSTRGYW